MFLEPKLNNEPGMAGSGWIEVICGPMFSGKTEELIRRVKRAVIAKQTVKIFKPALDNRYDEQDIVSHNLNKLVSIPVRSSQEIWNAAEGFHVIAIDEAQFFDEGIVAVCNGLANKGHRVIVSGLDMDFEGNPFGPMPFLLCTAEFVTKLHAICTITGEVASYSFRLSEHDERVLVGEKNYYEPRCRKAFVEGMRQKAKVAKPTS
jgi:thymidine kinase